MFLKAILLILFASAACGRIPSDPDKTLEKANATGLVVGYTVNPPWVLMKSDSVISGVEGDLINDFARDNSMKIIWQSGSEQKLFKLLEKKELNMVISGLTKDNPWKSKRIGMTKPYYKSGNEKHIIAVKQGENKLIMKLEKFLYDNKDSINLLINEYQQKF
jgi:hypothetical protein